MFWLAAYLYHKTGVFGLLFLIFLLFFQHIIHGTNKQNCHLKRSTVLLKYKLGRLSTRASTYFILEFGIYHQKNYMLFIFKGHRFYLMVNIIID
jgi:hypothetical protein